jgi:hypothetical protein
MAVRVDCHGNGREQSDVENPSLGGIVYGFQAQKTRGNVPDIH